MNITEEKYKEIAAKIKKMPVSVPKDFLDEFCLIYKIAEKHELHYFVPDPDNSDNIYICYSSEMNSQLYNTFVDKYHEKVDESLIYFKAAMNAFENNHPRAKKMDREDPFSDLFKQYEGLFEIKVGKR